MRNEVSGYKSHSVQCGNFFRQSFRGLFLSMKTASLSVLPLFLLLSLVTVAAPLFAFDDWQPISPDELKMTSEPAAPGAAAIILYREEKSDDNENYQYNYYRVKILTDEGKKYADVKVAYDNEYFHIVDIKGRTIHPDGTVIPFDGKVLDGTFMKERHLKILQKTFTLSDVQVGSIIEYKYKRRWEPGIAFSARWMVQEDLFQKHAVFSYAPYKHGVEVGGLNGSEVGYTTFLPKGSSVTHKYDHYDLEMTNIPAFVEEEYSPPADELKYRVSFYYQQGNIRTPEDYWSLKSREWSGTIGKFISHDSYIDDQVRQTVAQSDTPDQKLHKLYARVQQVTNLSFQRERGTAEQKAVNYKENKNADDVLRQNAGYHNDLTRLFVAMARSAGIDARLVRLATRDETFFSKSLLDFSQLNSEVAMVKIDGKDLYLDPGTRFCPYGLLEWQRTGVQGLAETRSSDAQFVTTSYPDLKDAVVQRVAVFNLSQDGNIKGKVRLVFSGQEALVRRLQENKNDETGRTKDLEDELRRMLPASAEIHLDEAKGWESFDQALDATFSVEIPGYAAATGKRLLLSTALFESNSKSRFVHEKRLNPIYFDYPYRALDQVTFNLPPSLQIESIPKQHKILEQFAGYVNEYQSQGQKLIFRRQIDVAGVAYPVTSYPQLKSFYEQVKSSDDETAVLNASSVAQK